MDRRGFLGRLAGVGAAALAGLAAPRLLQGAEPAVAPLAPSPWDDPTYNPQTEALPWEAREIQYDPRSPALDRVLDRVYFERNTLSRPGRNVMLGETEVHRGA